MMKISSIYVCVVNKSFLLRKMSLPTLARYSLNKSISFPSRHDPPTLDQPSPLISYCCSASARSSMARPLLILWRATFTDYTAIVS